MPTLDFSGMFSGSFGSNTCSQFWAGSTYKPGLLSPSPGPFLFLPLSLKATCWRFRESFETSKTKRRRFSRDLPFRDQYRRFLQPTASFIYCWKKLDPKQNCIFRRKHFRWIIFFFALRNEKKIQIPIFSRFLFPPPDFFSLFRRKNFSVFESKFRFRKLELRSFKLVFSAEIFHPEVFRRKCKFVIYAIFLFFCKSWSSDGASKEVGRWCSLEVKRLHSSLGVFREFVWL